MLSPDLRLSFGSRSRSGRGPEPRAPVRRRCRTVGPRRAVRPRPDARPDRRLRKPCTGRTHATLLRHLSGGTTAKRYRRRLHIRSDTVRPVGRRFPYDSVRPGARGRSSRARRRLRARPARSGRRSAPPKRFDQVRPRAAAARSRRRPPHVELDPADDRRPRRGSTRSARELPRGVAARRTPEHRRGHRAFRGRRPSRRTPETEVPTTATEPPMRAAPIRRRERTQDPQTAPKRGRSRLRRRTRAEHGTRPKSCDVNPQSGVAKGLLPGRNLRSKCR